MQTIETRQVVSQSTGTIKYRATAIAGTILIPNDGELSFEENHVAVARALITKFEWIGKYHATEWIGGQLKSGNFVFVANISRTRITIGEL